MCQLLVACRAQRAKGPGNAPSVGTRLSTYINRLLAAFPDTAHATPPTTEIHTRLSDNRTLVEPLSEREQEVLRLVAEGRSNSQIADQLIITVGTVKRHLNNIFGKLQVTSRTQALARARELNLL
ncbi:MAG: response regulator transcription factor [Caldilineaceae bacterium]